MWLGTDLAYARHLQATKLHPAMAKYGGLGFTVRSATLWRCCQQKNFVQLLFFISMDICCLQKPIFKTGKGKENKTTKSGCCLLLNVVYSQKHHQSRLPCIEASQLDRRRTRPRLRRSAWVNELSLTPLEDLTLRLTSFYALCYKQFSVS